MPTPEAHTVATLPFIRVRFNGRKWQGDRIEDHVTLARCGVSPYFTDYDAALEMVAAFGFGIEVLHA